jgi:tetratricopeptide repeat protein
VYPASDPRVARASGLLGISLAAQGKFDEARPLLARASRILDSAYTAKHPIVLEMSGALAQLDSARAGNESPTRAAGRFARYVVSQP